MTKQQITPCLWLDGQAEEAANFYVSVFKDGKINNISYYGNEGYEFHGEKEGTVLTVEFQINGQYFTAMNARRDFKFNDAISFQVFCDTQEDIDYYWENLTDGGEESMCGWLKDRFGLSWQVSPTILAELMTDPIRSPRVMKAFMQMKKLDIQKLKDA